MNLSLNIIIVHFPFDAWKVNKSPNVKETYLTMLLKQWFSSILGVGGI